MLEIRDVRLPDGSALAEVHVRAWQAAYRGIMPVADLDDLDAGARAEQWAATLSDRPPGFRCVVGEIEGRLCGFAAFGPDREGADAGELYALNVDPDFWGQHVGTGLLITAVNSLAESGFEEAILWVAPRNERARRFYEAHGWEADGSEREEMVYDVVVTEVRYHRPLTQIT